MPSSEQRRAEASPIPLPPPVITATRPSAWLKLAPMAVRGGFGGKEEDKGWRRIRVTVPQRASMHSALRLFFAPSPTLIDLLV